MPARYTATHPMTPRQLPTLLPRVSQQPVIFPSALQVPTPPPPSLFNTPPTYPMPMDMDHTFPSPPLLCPPATCSECNLPFPSADTKMRHEMYHHPKCYICEQKFVNFEDLANHTIVEHPYCIDCKELFKTFEELSSHGVEKHHDIPISFLSLDSEQQFDLIQQNFNGHSGVTNKEVR